MQNIIKIGDKVRFIKNKDSSGIVIEMATLAISSPYMESSQKRIVLVETKNGGLGWVPYDELEKLDNQQST